MKLLQFLRDLFEVENLEEITDEQISNMEKSIVENSSVKRKKVRHTQYNNMGKVIVTGDDRTCKACMKWDGKNISKKKFDEIFPIHPNCRCRWEKL